MGQPWWAAAQSSPASSRWGQEVDAPLRAAEQTLTCLYLLQQMQFLAPQTGCLLSSHSSLQQTGSEHRLLKVLLWSTHSVGFLIAFQLYVHLALKKAFEWPQWLRFQPGAQNAINK